MRKSIHNRVVIVGRSLQKLTTHLRRAEYLLQAIRVLVDVLSQPCKWLGLGVPQPAAYTQRGISLNGQRSQRKAE